MGRGQTTFGRFSAQGACFGEVGATTTGTSQILSAQGSPSLPT
jgi:hypothetical protein